MNEQELWEKELREIMIERGSVDDFQKVCNLITNLISSRDTYWKERVNRVLVAMSWSEENETSEAIRVLHEVRERLLITNEDNLK